MSPYRARAARVRALFCAGLQEGEFPSAAPPDPLLSEERRAELGNPDLRRADQPDEERYLFHACVSRPTERLYLSWQSCDEDGEARARSPFIDEVLDLVAPGVGSGRAAAAGTRSRARGDRCRARRPRHACSRGRSPRAGWSADRAAALERLGVGGDNAVRTLAEFDGLPDPGALPGPLRSPAVLEDMRSRRTFSANSLEGWVTCSYRWFVDHELSPQRLDPTADPLWLGGIVHATLERLYADPPGDDSIPRPRDVARWQRRFGELLGEVGRSDHAHPLAPRRARARASAGRGVPRRRGRFGDGVPPGEGAARARLRATRSRSRRTRRNRTRRSSWARSSCAGASTASTSPPTAAARSSATTRPASRSPALTSSSSAARFRSSSTCWSRAACSASIRSPASTSRSAPPPRGTAGRAGSPPPTIRGSPASTWSAATASPRRSWRNRSSAPSGSASETAAGMRAGLIRRDPLNGKCPQLLLLSADLPARAGARRRRRRARQRKRGAVSEAQLTLADLEPEGAAAAVAVARPRPEPTTEQAAAVAARRRDAFLEAGAGTGKTTVLVDRYCAAIVDDGVAVDRLLAFTFTERAAAEMRTRIRRELDAALARGPRAGGCRHRRRAAGARAGDRARLGDDDPRLLPAAARRPPAGGGARPRVRRARRESGSSACATGPSATRSRACWRPATTRSRVPRRPTSRGGWPR